MKRSRDPADRRRYIVTLTPAGRSALAKVIDAVERYTDTFLGPLTSSERDQLGRAQAKLYATTPGGHPRTNPDQENHR